MSDETVTSNEMNFGTFDDDYAIVGEVRGTAGRRTFLATRRSDGAEVLLTVLGAAEFGDNNALSHFASDTKILSGARHRGVLQPLDGRWIGSTAFAVVTERPHGATVRQAVAAGERFTNPHIATLLQDVNAVLVWAREQGIVHRGVLLDSIYIEPMSGRIQLSMMPTPIPPDGVPDSLADSQTIGKLALALLSGRTEEKGETLPPLAELRPDLAARVVADVERMRSAPGEVVHPDVLDFIATIATADVLKASEVELERQRAEYAELLRVHQETAEAERNACERRAVELQEQLEEERREFERQVAEQQKVLESDRAQLTAEQAQLAYELGALEKRRASDTPVVPPPPDPNVLTWPDVDRRARARRLVGPMLVTGA